MTTMSDPQLHPRARVIRAKRAAHDAFIAAKSILDHLDETADPVWIAHAKAAMDHTRLLYEDLVRETEW